MFYKLKEIMIEVRSLTKLNLTDLRRVASGYTSNGKYVVAYADSESEVSFNLQLIALEQLYVREYDHFDAEILERITIFCKAVIRLERTTAICLSVC